MPHWPLPALFFLASLPAWGQSTAPFRFAIVGDRTGRAVPRIYEQVWREVSAAKPDFAITVGDSIEGMEGIARARAEWEALKPVWPRALKIYQTPGNHDIWNEESARLFTAETGDSPSYSFDRGHAHFIVLDNSRTDDLSPQQLQFLELDLQRNQGKSPTLIFFHRPFWLIPLTLGQKDFALHRLARRYGVCCIVSGHGHQFQTRTEDGVFYLEVGSSGANLAAGIAYDDGWFYQYVYATVNGPSVDFEVRELGPPFGQSRVRKLHAGARGNNPADKHRDSAPVSPAPAAPSPRPSALQ